MKHRILRAHATTRGMTLIEIMIVIAIISLVLGGVGLMAFRAYERAQLSTAYNRTVQLQQAVGMYRAQHRGRCPLTLEALVASGIVQRMPTDPWGSKFAILCEAGAEPVVTSSGPDRELGNEDDVASNGEDPGAEKEEESQ